MPAWLTSWMRVGGHASSCSMGWPAWELGTLHCGTMLCFYGGQGQGRRPSRWCGPAAWSASRMTGIRQAIGNAAGPIQELVLRADWQACTHRLCSCLR